MRQPYLSFHIGNVDLNVPVSPVEVKRRAAISNRKMQHRDSLKPIRQMGFAYFDHAIGGVNINGEARL
jgi:hypothetical protein